MVVITAVAFGGESGFLVGAVSMLCSNIFLSQGPWTPFQMFAMGVIGFLAGVLFRKGGAPPELGGPLYLRRHLRVLHLRRYYEHLQRFPGPGQHHP